MRLRSLATFAVAVVAMFGIYACSGDSPAAPNSAAVTQTTPLLAKGSGSAGSAYAQPYQITPVLRTASLASDMTVSKTIGILGGTISLPSAGLTMVVPPGAVLTNTPFKITARKGSYLAYDFEPHGTNFRVPLVVTQSFASGEMPASLIFCYYPDPTRVTTVTQLMTVQLDLLKRTAVSTVTHFSGYIFAGGLTEE